MKRLVRLLLVLVLVHGLVPDLVEIGEAVLHYARTGHAAHTAADRGDLGDQGPEHGCGTTRHRCECCAPQPLAPSRPAALAAGEGVVTRPPSPPELTLAVREPARPFRPPIS